MLFDRLPVFPPALPTDEIRLLARLPQWDEMAEIEPEEEAACRRLARRRLVKISRQLADPAGTLRIMYAGRIDAGFTIARADARKDRET